VADQARGQVEPAPHAAGVGLGRAVGRLGEVEPFEQLGRALPRVLVGEVEQQADQHQVLGAGQVLVDARVLAGETDAAAHPLRLLEYVDAGHLRMARIGAQQGGEHPYGGGLAGAVGPEHAEHRAPAHRQIHPVERLCLAESLAESLRANHEIAHDPVPSFAGLAGPREGDWRVALTSRAHAADTGLSGRCQVE
jgi:hypothetical protein